MNGNGKVLVGIPVTALSTLSQVCLIQFWLSPPEYIIYSSYNFGRKAKPGHFVIYCPTSYSLPVLSLTFALRDLQAETFFFPVVCFICKPFLSFLPRPPTFPSSRILFPSEIVCGFQCVGHIKAFLKEGWAHSSWRLWKPQFIPHWPSPSLCFSRPRWGGFPRAFALLQPLPNACSPGDEA